MTRTCPCFGRAAAKKTAQAFNIPLLGSIPFDPLVVEAADQGELLKLAETDEGPFFQALRPIVKYLLQVLPPQPEVVREPGVSVFAVPVVDGQAALKFSQAGQFAIIKVKDQMLQDRQLLNPPPVSVSIPSWLEELGVTHVFAGDLELRSPGVLETEGHGGHTSRGPGRPRRPGG